MNITIKGRIPSKKNCKMALPIKGRCMVVNSTAYSKWKKEAAQQLMTNGNVWPKAPLERATVEMWFYAPDRRATDLTNKAESIMDLLVENGILKDDNCEVVPFLNLYYGGVCKENPRMEIKISI